LSFRSVPTRRVIENSKKNEKKPFMASLQAKTRWKRLKKRENKNYRFVSFRPDALEKNSRKIAKKFNKLKNTVMASFQTKIGWKRLRNRENKNCRSVSFPPNAY